MKVRSVKCNRSEGFHTQQFCGAVRQEIEIRCAHN